MTQRAYRAACPNCGAPVEFASAASASAVCSFCRSTLLRDGDALRRIGISAELFDDHSPLQLGARGTRQGLAFTLVGRVQMAYEGGTWNEWHALFDNGRSAWISEDNGAYVIAFEAPLPADAPATADELARLRAGQRVLADGRAWDVASITTARVLAAQGELPSPPRLEGDFRVVDLRNNIGEVATLDASDPARLHWSVGRTVALSELAFTGLKEASEKTLRAQGLECPNCGSALAPQLASTQSLSCPQCSAVVDISAGAGAALKHYLQNNAGTQGAEPQIPLGRSGTLPLGGPPQPWQVVGYLERCDIPESSEDETSYWREYLLFNRLAGFAFLVDSNEGWSWVRPLTGAPTVRGNQAQWKGTTYQRQVAYGAKVTWVQGEFYWRVEREERAHVIDYVGTGQNSRARLSREQAGSEVTWSAGETLSAATVAEAFGIPKDQRSALQRDSRPLAGKSGGTPGVLVMFIVLVMLVMLLSECDGDECDEVRATFGAASTEYQECQRRAGSGGARTGGGSFGGWSSGGGHK